MNNPATQKLYLRRSTNLKKNKYNVRGFTFKFNTLITDILFYHLEEQPQNKTSSVQKFYNSPLTSFSFHIQS